MSIEENRSKEQPGSSLLPSDPEGRKIRGAIQQIQAKEFISVKEAAVRLNCSERPSITWSTGRAALSVRKPYLIARSGKQSIFLSIDLPSSKKGFLR